MVADLDRKEVGRKLTVAEVLDQVKADHLEDSLDVADAALLVTLAEGLITGSKLRGRSRWAAVIGPVLKPGPTSKLLGISSTALDKRRKSAAVLGVQTETGRWVYPLAQFRTGGRPGVEVLPGLSDVLVELLGSGDGLGAARWLATPNRRLGAATPWEALADPANHPDVVTAARAQASSWAGR